MPSFDRQDNWLPAVVRKKATEIYNPLASYCSHRRENICYKDYFFHVCYITILVKIAIIVS